MLAQNQFVAFYDDEIDSSIHPAETVEATESEMSLVIPVSNKRIDRAGLALADRGTNAEDRQIARGLVEQWRASFIYPLRKVAFVLGRAARDVDRDAIFSSRLKRMDSIVDKLRRDGNVKNLSTMQDIGGCRVVLKSCADAWELKRRWSFRDTMQGRFRDYILDPKIDGYRGIHGVDRFKARHPRYAAMDGRRTEIQIRTSLQHSWATSVETVDLFAKQRLKVGEGDSRWGRFFSLSSSAFALQEDSPIVPGTPTSAAELRGELASLWEELDVLDQMSGWATTVGSFPTITSAEYTPEINRMESFLVVMDAGEKELNVTPFSEDEAVAASAAYAHEEHQIRNGKNAYAVLVSVDGVMRLHDAYPNLYADTKEFLIAIDRFIG
jgi:hypothetical protein